VSALESTARSTTASNSLAQQPLWAGGVNSLA
jgi:hypothetical protein